MFADKNFSVDATSLEENDQVYFFIGFKLIFLMCDKIEKSLKETNSCNGVLFYVA